MEFDNAIVLKISKSDKRMIRKVAQQKRLPKSTYMCNSKYSKALQEIQQ